MLMEGENEVMQGLSQLRSIKSPAIPMTLNAQLCSWEQSRQFGQFISLVSSNHFSFPCFLDRRFKLLQVSTQGGPLRMGIIKFRRLPVSSPVSLRKAIRQIFAV